MLVKYFDDTEEEKNFGIILSGPSVGKWGYVLIPSIKEVDEKCDGNFIANEGYDITAGKEMWRLKFQTRLLPLHEHKTQATNLGYTSLAAEIQIKIDYWQAKLDALA